MRLIATIRRTASTPKVDEPNSTYFCTFVSGELAFVSRTQIWQRKRLHIKTRCLSQTTL